MKTGIRNRFVALALLALCALNSPLSTAFAQGTTAFTYNGVLTDSGSPAQGSYDLRFTLYDAGANGNDIASLTNTATSVTNGLFTATLDFGAVFSGTNYWLELAARTNGGGAFATLSPRQPVLPAPYALYSANAGNAVTATTAITAATAGSATNVPLTGLQQSGAVAGQSLIWNGTAWAPSYSGSLATNYYAFATNAAQHNPDPSSSTLVDGLSVSFTLPGARDVTISFSIVSTKTAGYDTYQIFDGSTAIAPGNGSMSWFSLPGNTATPSSSLSQTELTASTMLNLASGAHTIKVQFQAAGGTQANTFYDRSLQVSVH
jgi:hypothetical protein